MRLKENQMASHSLTMDARKKAADAGQAMPNGDYPIRDRHELASAIKLAGKSKTYSLTQVKHHVIKRAKALGATALLPDGWQG
jgi:hypothetical protein